MTFTCTRHSGAKSLEIVGGAISLGISWNDMSSEQLQILRPGASPDEGLREKSKSRSRRGAVSPGSLAKMGIRQ
jgi:hypothetical protein